MRKRGKILRDTSAGPGLLIVEGRQYQFPREGVWRSEVSPRPGMVVDVDFEVAPSLFAITPVPEFQLAHEQAGADLSRTRQQHPALSSAGNRLSSTSLAAAAVLMIAWFFLPALSLDTPLGSERFTFWEVLGFLNARDLFDVIVPGANAPASPGFYVFPAILVLGAPFLRWFWHDRRACLGGLLPLLFMAIIGLMVRGSIDSMLAQNTADGARNLAVQSKYEVMKTMSLGLGTYLSLLAGAYLAAEGSLQYLADHTSRSQPIESFKASV